ncbi:hypothetical protein PMAYCL1PPCAC_08917, partial [Pristionchus mayeri]
TDFLAVSTISSGLIGGSTASLELFLRQEQLQATFSSTSNCTSTFPIISRKFPNVLRAELLRS